MTLTGWRTGQTVPIAPIPDQWRHLANACPFDIGGAHDFDAHTSDAIVVQLHCRRCGLILPDEVDRVVHTYKGEGLTACGLEVVGPCPDCERAT